MCKGVHANLVVLIVKLIGLDCYAGKVGHLEKRLVCDMLSRRAHSHHKSITLSSYGSWSLVDCNVVKLAPMYSGSMKPWETG
jgi:hypothetical protein